MFVAIANVANDDDRSASFRVVLDGGDLCERVVSGHATARFDCVVSGWKAGGAHTVLIASGSRAWHVESAEIATHSGRSHGLGDFLVLPLAMAPRHVGLSPLTLLGLVTAALLCVKPHRRPTAVHMAGITITATATILGVAIVIVPFVTPFIVLVSPATLIWWTLAALATQVLTVAEFVLVHVLRRIAPSRHHLLACATVALLAGASFWIIVGRQVADHRGNYSAFLHVSQDAFERHPVLAWRADVRQTLILENPGGYDGQFIYMAAFDPFLRAARMNPAPYLVAFDDIAYRYGRIGFAWMIDVFSLGDWRRFPTTAIWLLLTSVCALAFALGRMAQERGRSSAWGLLVVAVPGFWQSIQYALPETIVAALMLAAVMAEERRRAWLAASLLAFAMLMRETVAVLTVCLVAAAWLDRHRDRRWAVLAASFVPVAAWRLYVGAMLYPSLGASAFVGAAPVIGWPFAGLAEMWARIGAGTYFPGTPGMASAGVALTVLIAAGGVLSWLMAWRQRDAVAIAAAIYAFAIMLFSYGTVWVHVGNGQRTSFELFVLLAVVTVRERDVSMTIRRGLQGFWIASAGYVFLGAYDAHIAREALPLLVAATSISLLVWSEVDRGRVAQAC